MAQWLARSKAAVLLLQTQTKPASRLHFSTLLLQKQTRQASTVQLFHTPTSEAAAATALSVTVKKKTVRKFHLIVATLNPTL